MAQQIARPAFSNKSSNFILRMTLESLNLNHSSELLYEATSYSLLSDHKLDDAVCGLSKATLDVSALSPHRHWTP